MKNIKYIIIGILICILVVGTFIFKKVTIHTKEAFISIGNNNLIEIKDDNWKYVTSNRLSDFEWNKFNIYDGKEYLGNYNIQYNDKWYIFDDDYNSIDYNNTLFMIRGTNVKFYDFEKQDINENDLNDIKETLDKLKIIYNVDKINAHKIYIDVDDDGVNEELFIVSSSYEENISEDGTTLNNNDDSNLYSLIYLVKNNKKYFLEKTVMDSQQDYYIMPGYLVDYIIKLGNDNNYKFVIYKSYFGSTDEKCYSVYEFKNNKIKTLLKAELDYGDNDIKYNSEKIDVSTIILTISLLGGIVGFVIIMLYLKQKANNEI